MTTGPSLGEMAEPACLFVYGTLVEPRCLDEVIGRRHAGERLRARLRDFVRIETDAYPYPYVAEAPGRSVEGVVVMDLSTRDWQALDRYEDLDQGMDRRQIVEIEAFGCGPRPYRLQAHVYVAGPGLGGSTASELNYNT